MLVSEAHQEAYEMLGDVGGFVYTLPLFLRHLNKTLVKVGQLLDDSSRTSINLVASQQDYDLPTGLRTITKVRLVPENSTSTTCELLPIRLEDVPVFTPNETDPTHYYLQPSGGANNNQFSMFVWPTPARSATNAIIVDYTPDYTLALGSDTVPFPDMFNAPIVLYTAGSMLVDREDAKDVESGRIKMQKAMDELTSLRTFQPVQYMGQSDRRFP